MIRISRTGIKNLASNDKVYARGVQYYKDKRVVNATYSKSGKQYRMDVKGNFNYSVVVDEQEDGTFDYNCNCPSRLKDQGACKHVIASLLFILKYQERTIFSKTKSPSERKAIEILDYFASQVDSMLMGEVFHLDTIITIPSMIKEDMGKAEISFKGGSSRKYKIQSLKKFIGDVYKGESFSLGKEFRYIGGESTFDRQSQEILEYLFEIYEIQEVTEISHQSNLFSKSNLSMTKNMLIRFLNIIKDDTFTLELYGKTYEDVRFVVANPKVNYKISMDDDSIMVDYVGNENVVPMTDTGELLFYENAIYMPDNNFIRNFKPFYNTLGGEKDALVFKDESRNRFLEHVLPKISDTMKLDIPKELMSRYIFNDLEPKIYFDIYKSGIKAELIFKYGEHEINSFENASSGQYIIVRQREDEDKIIDELIDHGFHPYKNFYMLDNEDSIYKLFTDGVEKLSEKADLYYSDDFRKVGIRQPGNFKAGLRYNLDINMLELDIDFDEVPREELRDLFHSFQIKKKYYRLKDGSFINLDDKILDEVLQIFNSLDIDSKDITDDALILDKQHAVYLDKSFTNRDFEIEKDRDFSELTDRILNPTVTDYKLPNGIEADLRPYQVTGYKWLRNLAEYDLGGILADDMGLGKTLQSIVYIASYLQEACEEPFLIVSPTSLVYNWLDEIENFAPFISAKVVNGTPKERQAIIKKYKDYDVLITSYPLIRRDIFIYEEINFHTVFIDEAQYIKNDSSLNSRSVKRLVSNHRFALTGTPIENNLSELWSIFDFVMPGFLFRYGKFLEVFEKPILREDKDALRELHQRIGPFILRRMKKDVLKELPEKHESKMLTELTQDQKLVYMSYLENLKGNIDKGIEEKGYERSKMQILAALTRLRQICCHPSTFIDNYQGGSGKLELLMEILVEGIANNHRTLVFSQFTSMLDIIEEELKEVEIPYFYLQGSTKTKVRNDIVKRFNDGEGDVFLISLKAGGTGLNLTGADTVIHYDPWWNPAVEDQATDRAHRIGQKNELHVMKLITKGTIEEKIYKLQKKKKKLSDAVIDSQELFINTLTREELEDLFTPIF